ncbi:aminoglycoside phosphotransferase family protein [Streptomyces niveiscabiei]|uniref:aminoglycoside phosphotransferase family protein n=1 Tax=Streptomyces niveiscabiei TaxID=164115 RepID=UPI0029B988B8|nr:aminoglycoside phosphotransferase family protein [Streptomyces niveiscabiei]MDX3385691.1 aminoglycoside phosphotransferase family protein [Streptomyces niveiscabiei]
MTANPSVELLDNLLAAIGRTSAVREEVRVWSMSGVERVTFPDSTTTVVKYAKKPFDSEDQALRLAHTLGVPVPQVHASAVLDGWLDMLMVGPSVREADDLDGAAAAVILHSTRTAPPLPVLDQERLRTLPARALEYLERLRKADRWQDADDVEDTLAQIARAAARAFTGPVLRDLASWHGTIGTPDPVRLRVFLEQYVTAGGTPDALTAESWALGWHRMWAVEWFMEQAVRWIADPAADPAYIKDVRRHLADTLLLLEV